MSLSNFFYHGLTRKYVAAFGSLFNGITIERVDEDTQNIKKFIVPIAYGPWQKFLNKKIQDPKHNNSVAITLPRISFEIVGLNYDPQRKLPSIKKLKLDNSNSIYVPVPYNIEFSLSIMGKYIEDIYKIQEQILPFFTPEYTPALKVIESLEALDTPITITSVSMEDSYEGDYETRRAIIATITFMMKVEFYAPIRERKLIKFIDIDYHADMEQNGVPIGNTSQWVFDKDDLLKPYQDVDETDNWGLELIITEEES